MANIYKREQEVKRLEEEVLMVGGGARKNNFKRFLNFENEQALERMTPPPAQIGKKQMIIQEELTNPEEDDPFIVDY